MALQALTPMLRTWDLRGTIAFYTEVVDVARVCSPIENFEYRMREFAIYDNNGYMLQFGQELGGAA